ncbi:ABC transporter ATP-binding protein/permease [Alphaproteobacteria bacterium]|nr:ABC transporter ATP-binding protein/permease [Alphaproteobacteria bacterium]
MAIIEMIGVASILPFMAVLTNPNLVETNSILNKLFQSSSMFGINNNQQFLTLLGVLVFVFLIISIIFKAFTTFAQTRFIQMRDYSIGKRLIEAYLRQPYSWFLNQHSSDLGKNILSEVGQVVLGGLAQFIELIAKGMISIVMIILLIMVDPIIALTIGFSLSGAYLLIFLSIKIYLKKIGTKRFQANELRYKVADEAFNAIKEIEIRDLKKYYVKRFSDPAKIFFQTNTTSQILSLLPRFLLEAITFGGILILILYMMSKTNSFTDALPIISLYVFAGYRLMPALQNVYSAFTKIIFNDASIDKLYSDFKNLKSFNVPPQGQDILSLNKSINLKNIHFNYPNSKLSALKNINLNIPANSTVGFIGTTGSGKTTIVDIILGLLEAQKGTLEVDGQVISKQNSKTWQRTIGYVPQNIYLIDDTLAANIAFGEDPENINLEIVEKVSKIANLHEFVKNELPMQYQTTIGERGIRLSGGQRQRIGIARALYHDPQLLVLDEATSALDSKTEQIVMNSINNLRKNITIILIAHRLNTVKSCDIIFKIDKGKLVDEGSYDKLIGSRRALS